VVDFTTTHFLNSAPTWLLMILQEIAEFRCTCLINLHEGLLSYMIKSRYCKHTVYGGETVSPRQRILNLMLPQPEKWWYGFEIGQATGLNSATVSQQLYILESEDILESRWEDFEEAGAAKRPRRRFYRLTPRGNTQQRNS
jgi:hypothetical protein